MPNALADRLTELLRGEPGIAAAWLFGSRARGEERAGSDVDLALLFDRPRDGTLADEPFELEARLSAAIRLPVRVVVADRAPADLVHRVLRDGILLVENDPSRRVRFEVRKRNEYWDLLPIRRAYRQAG